jgi:hypothetical protein
MKDGLPRADGDAAHADPERPHPDDIRQELNRIINSSPFRDAYRLTSFLSFIVEMTLAGNGNKLKAYTIAVEALGRGPISTRKPIRSCASRRAHAPGAGAILFRDRARRSARHRSAARQLCPGFPLP